jgi:acyl-CoA hydrolase
MDDLAEVGLPSLAHHLVETLEDIVAFDPPGVFRRVAAVVKAAQRYGYTYESLAADRIVKLVRRYLADYRPLLQEDARSRQALMEVLSAFVHWPEASRLVFQLEDIWR